MSFNDDSYVQDHMWNGRYEVKHAIRGVVASGSIEACRAVLGLYLDAFDARTEVRTSVRIVKQPLEWSYAPPFVQTEAERKAEEAAWFANVNWANVEQMRNDSLDLQADIEWRNEQEGKSR